MPSGERRETPGHQAAPCVPSSGFGFIVDRYVCLSRLLGSAPIVLVGGKPSFETEREVGRDYLVARRRGWTPTRRRRLAAWRTVKFLTQIIISQLAAWALRHWL
jgi:hypothetical protein